MPTTYVTRTVHFSAAHRYHRPEWSESRNREVFGACANPYGHGHNYTLEVTVAGEPDLETGFAVDLKNLDGVLADKVVRPLDHRHLNHAVPDFGPHGSVPTTENLVIWLWRQIEPEVGRPSRLLRLRLREMDDLYVDYYGPGSEEGRGRLKFV